MDRIRMLLDSHDEPYDSELSRGERSTTGFAEPTPRTKLCAECAGAGCLTCAAARAQAWAEHGKRIPKGRILYFDRDPMDDGVKGFWAGVETKTMDDHQIERELRKLREDELKRNDVIANIDFEKTLIAAEQRDRRGDYQRLRVLMSDHMPRGLRGEAQIRWLAENMPGTIRIPSWAYAEELRRMDAEIRELKNLGLNDLEIAAELGIPRRQVKHSLRRTKS